MANLLTEITERTGAKQLFRYEAHSSGKTGSNVLVGGARIAEINVQDGKGNSYKRLFSYRQETNASLSSGYLYKDALYLLGDYSFNRRFSHPYKNNFDLNGGFIGYSRVEEIIPGHGRTVYSFTNYDSNPDIKLSSTTTEYDCSWQRGLISRQRAYGRIGNLTSEQLTEYTFNAPLKRTVETTNKFGWTWSCGPWYNSKSGSFTHTATSIAESRVLTARSQTSITYDPLDVNKKMVRVKNMTYDYNGYLIKSEDYDASTPSLKYISEVKYAADISYDNNYCQTQYNDCMQDCMWNGYPGCETDCSTYYNYCIPPASSETAAIDLLRQKHMVVPIEEQSWLEKDNVRIFKGAVVNTFMVTGPSTNRFVVPKQVYQLAKTTTSYTASYVDGNGNFVKAPGFKLVSDLTFNSTNGVLESATNSSGITTHYTYGHENTLLTQVQENSGANTQTTSYTHKPLVGITASVDPNGRTSYTEYDPLGRRKLEKDHDNNILARYRYHYKGEKPNFTLTTSGTQAYTNQPISFTISDVLTTSGTSVFKWNMGDGTLYSDNRTYVSKSYPTPGTYQVNVTMENTDYANTVKTVPITVYSPMVLQTCVDGPVWRNTCGSDVMYGNCTTYQDPWGYANVKVSTVGTNTGCPGYQYYWEYRDVNNGWWYYLGNTQDLTFTYNGNYQLRCTVTDGCGNQQVIEDVYINYFCGSGGPGGPIMIESTKKTKGK